MTDRVSAPVSGSRSPPAGRSIWSSPGSPPKTTGNALTATPREVLRDSHHRAESTGAVGSGPGAIGHTFAPRKAWAPRPFDPGGAEQAGTTVELRIVRPQGEHSMNRLPAPILVATDASE